MNIYKSILYLAAMTLTFYACSDDDEEADTTATAEESETESDSDDEADYAYVGQAVGNFAASEWYPGGTLGTTTNRGSTCYEDPTPAVEEQGLLDEFNHGEYFFEASYTIGNEPFVGLGPVYARTSCMDCHPGYGHGKRQTGYTSTWGNGYILIPYYPDDGDNSNDGEYIEEVNSMILTQATDPFLPPLDESGVTITWKTVTEMESGLPLYFPDGETYELIYPEVSVNSSAYNTDPIPSGNIAYRLASSIGIIGTGLLDAIPDDSIRAQYQSEADYYTYAGMDIDEYINTDIWDAATGDFTDNGYTTLPEGYLADGTYVTEMKRVNRFTYFSSYASTQENSSIWEVSNITRGDIPYVYTTSAWALAMSENDDVVAAIMDDPTSPYYADGTEEGVRNAVRTLLDPETNLFDNDIYCFEPEMDDDEYYDFIVWHRGLAIPRARNLHNTQVQRGKEVFIEIGCANCHRPSWTTTDDNYWTPAIAGGQEMPRYQDQTIYPYTDMVQHKLYMINDIYGSWCRTTPLWGRGLSLINTGAQDRLHDCRARNETEAIMWHGYSKDSHAYESTEKFYNLDTDDREAVVKFLQSI